MENVLCSLIIGSSTIIKLQSTFSINIFVAQVHGVAVSSGIASVDLATGAVGVAQDTARGSRTVSIDGITVQSAATVTLTEARGMVKTYEVVAEQQVSPDVYEVTLDAWVFSYQSPEAIKPIRLAVMPVEVQVPMCRFGDRDVPAARVAQQFTQALTGDLSQNEHFTLLDRESTAAIDRERRILKDQDVTPREKVRLQAVLGADYLVVVTVPQVELRVKETINPAIGRPTREFDARLQAEFRLLVGPTRQVSMADDLRIRLEDNQVSALAAEWNVDDIDYAELQGNFIGLAAGRVAGAILDYLNPVKIAAVVEGGQVILNQGGKRFVVGDQYDVGRPAQTIVDPATGKALGTHHQAAGTIQIVKVLPRISYAKVVTGTLDSSVVGYACWRATGIEDSDKIPNGRQKTEVEKTPSTGVKLPFDR